MRQVTEKALVSDQYLYLHVYSDGDIFVFKKRDRSGSFVTPKTAVKLLRSLEAKNGRLLYSLEESAAPHSPECAEILNLIRKSKLHAEIVDPHPAVYGYRHSYAPYIEQAVEAAEIDVDGLRRCLSDAKRILQLTEPGTPEYSEREKLCGSLRKRLRDAKRALARISRLHLELLVEERR
jgi:hypothetical protein